MINSIIRRVIGITLFATVWDIVLFGYFDNELSVTRHILNMLFMSGGIIYIIAGYKEEERDLPRRIIKRYNKVNSDPVLKSIIRKLKKMAETDDKEKLRTELYKRHIYLMQQYSISQQ